MWPLVRSAASRGCLTASCTKCQHSRPAPWRLSITEIDFINGAVVQQGARYGIPTPVNQTLVAAIKGLEKACYAA